MSTVERTVQVATTVDDLSAAWAFIMAHVDEVTDPRIVVSPYWHYETSTDDDSETVRRFEVSVSGSSKEQP